MINNLEKEEEDVLLKVPNKLLITSYHISRREAGRKGVSFKEIFGLSSELFDPKYPYKQSR